MRIVSAGSGVPLVLVPGVQCRWEWMKPAVDALARRCRVVTFSLADEPTCGAAFDEKAGFDCYVRQVADAMDLAGVERAVICGVSYGGLIAAAFAARYPARVDGLVLASALPPTWTPDRRVNFYLRAPRLLVPLFMLASLRMYREIAAAAQGMIAGAPSAIRHGLNVLAHMFSPSRMARRVRLLAGLTIGRELTRVRVPTLIVTGEDGLDRVVPPWLTREYLKTWPHAETAVIARTGHIGLITRPAEFARVVGDFAERTAGMEARRRIG